LDDLMVGKAGLPPLFGCRARMAAQFRQILQE
jgi:hypothetical protein